MRNRHKIILLMLLILFPGISKADLIGHWELDHGVGAIAYDSIGSNNGTIYGASWTGGLFSNALSFDGDGDYVRIPRIYLDDFSVSFWVNTEQDPINTTHWYNANGLVDAEKREVRYDWGTSLIDDGKVAFGIGRPDTTIKSTSLVNNGDWHFVTATRNKSTGKIELYINGNKESEGTGNTHTLDQIDYIGIGNNSSDVLDNDEWFQGIIDDVRIYDHVLTQTEIDALVPEPTTLLLFGLGVVMMRKIK